MNQLVLVNLAIHGFWGRRLPGPPVLNDSFVNLGYYLGDANSLVVVEPTFTREYLAFLELHGGPRAKTVQVPAYAKPIQWAEAVVSGLPPGHKIEKFIFTGISELEVEILKRIAPHAVVSGTLENYRFLNRKSSLQKIAIDLGIKMPAGIEIDGLDFRSEMRGPFLLKPDLGQSGAGQIFSHDVPIDFLKSAARLSQEAGGEFKWLLQKFIEAKYNLSLFGEGGSLLGAFRNFYDQGRVSYRHLAIGSEPSLAEPLAEATRAYYKLSRYLADKFNYSGGFGVDTMVDVSGQVFPVVDLNVRLDKSRLIHEAAKLFSVPGEEIDAYRLRITGGGFAQWWDRCRADLDLNTRGDGADGAYFYPFLYTGQEVHFFSGVKGSRPELEESAWLKRIIKTLGKT